MHAGATVMKRTEPEMLDVSDGQLQEIVQYFEAAVDAKHYKFFRALLDSYTYLVEVLNSKNVSISRLQKLVFAARTEKTKDVMDEGAKASTSESLEETPPTEPTEETDSQKEPRISPQGHGRNGVDAFPGAQRVPIPHESLQAGDDCPKCAEGTVYAMPPAVFLRFTGHAPVGAEIYECERLRCNLCGAIFTAEPPPGVHKQREYDVTVPSIIALLKYGSGFPFNRLDGLQRNFGIPLPASTQWDIVHHAAKPLAPVLDELARQAALGDIVYHDDTMARILDWMAESGPVMQDLRQWMTRQIDQRLVEPPFSLRWFIGVRGHSGEATGVRCALPCLGELRQGTASSAKARTVPRSCDLRLKEETANPHGYATHIPAPSNGPPHHKPSHPQ